MSGKYSYNSNPTEWRSAKITEIAPRFSNPSRTFMPSAETSRYRSRMSLSDFGPALFGAALGILIVGLLALAIVAGGREESRQTGLIQSGACEIVGERRYQPPPVVTMAGKTPVVIPRPARDQWLFKCGEEQFWRDK